MFSKAFGGVAAILGAGCALLIALSTPANQACISQLAGVFGTTGAHVGTIVLGAVATVAPFAAWFAKHPTAPSEPPAPTTGAK